MSFCENVYELYAKKNLFSKNCRVGTLHVPTLLQLRHHVGTKIVPTVPN